MAAVGSSYTRYINSLPIDIHIDKLLEWLISRNYCTRQWYAPYSELINNLNSFIESSDSFVDAKTIFHNHGINIFSLRKVILHCQNVNAYDQLKKFQSILKKMESNGIGLAGSSSELTKLMIHDLKVIKKTSNDLQKTILECEKMFKSKNQLIETVQEQFKNKCLKIGITPVGIEDKYDLLTCAKALDTKFSQTFLMFKTISDPINFYINYVERNYNHKINPQVDDILSIIKKLDDNEFAPINEFEIGLVEKSHNIFNDTNYRHSVIVGLVRLLSFYQQYLGTINSELSTQCKMDDIQLVPTNEWVCEIKKILENLDSKSLEIPLLIQSSFSYRRRIEFELNSMKTQYHCALNDKFKLQQTYEEALSKYAQNERYFSTIVSKTRFFYQHVKEEISKHYKERTINFLADSNKFLN